MPGSRHLLLYFLQAEVFAVFVCVCVCVCVCVFECFQFYNYLTINIQFTSMLTAYRFLKPVTGIQVISMQNLFSESSPLFSGQPHMDMGWDTPYFFDSVSFVKSDINADVQSSHLLHGKFPDIFECPKVMLLLKPTPYMQRMLMVYFLVATPLMARIALLLTSLFHGSHPKRARYCDSSGRSLMLRRQKLYLSTKNTMVLTF